MGEPEGFGKNANNSIMKQWKICLSVSSLLLDSVLCALRLCHCSGVLVESERFLKSSLLVVTALCALRQCHCRDVLVVSFCVSSLLVVTILCALR